MYGIIIGKARGGNKINITILAEKPIVQSFALRRAVLLTAKSELASKTTLKANQAYTWDAKIDLPETVLPTFMGTNAKHTWQAKASLVMRGNDPDTGWLGFEVG